MGNYIRLSIKQETKDRFNRCYAEYLKHHPADFHKMTEDYMLDQVCRFYLDEE